MSKNRRFSETKRERERDKVKEPRRKQQQQQQKKKRKRRRLENKYSLSRSHFFRRARPSAKELLRMLLVFIFVIFLISPFKVSPVWGKREMRRLQTLLFLVLFAFFAEQTTIASGEEEEGATTTATSKCLDRGYDPDVIRCDYCRFAMKDALGGEHDELVRECLECCTENDEDGDSSSMTRESGVKFDRATITACS